MALDLIRPNLPYLPLCVCLCVCLFLLHVKTQVIIYCVVFTFSWGRIEEEGQSW